jgi:hypothetical protein
MRHRLTMLATLALCAFSAGAASAQTPLDCSIVPQNVCADPDLIALENERAALIAQLAALDPQNAALPAEQTWIDGLGACGEDIACYRTAYLNHNQALRQSVAALPGAALSEPPLEVPEDAPSLEEQTSVLDELQEERLREPQDPGQAYVEGGVPGWGFFTAIGVTLLIFWWLMRALGKHRRELRAEEARLRRY